MNAKNHLKSSQITFLEDCLLINKTILVIGDMHIGFEEHIIVENALPNIQLNEILKKLERIFLFLKKEKIILKKIILLGDLKHEFGGISNTEWRDVLKLINYLNKKTRNKVKIILIKGNHDNILGPITEKKSIKLKNYYKFKKICFLHGNKLWKNCLNNCNMLIMGHLHPSITLKNKYKKEKYKCFLKGKWRRKQIYILPSFSNISFGYDLVSLKNEDSKKGFIIIDNHSLKNCEVIVYNFKEHKIHNFGKLKEFLKMQD